MDDQVNSPSPGLWNVGGAFRPCTCNNINRLRGHDGQADRDGDGDGRVSECCVVGGVGDSVCVLYGACVHMNVYCRCV